MPDMPRSPEEAAEFVRTTMAGKPDLIVRSGNLPATARALRDLLAASGQLFDRDMPVKLVEASDGGPMLAIPLTANNVIIETHDRCQPVCIDSQGTRKEVTLQDRVARMLLDMRGEWHLPALAGISTAPLLAEDGSIRDALGYDPKTGLWCCKVPSLTIPERPSREDASEALALLRQTFRTFPFANATRCRDRTLGVDVVDLQIPPGHDESAFLAGLITAICRPSLWLAPGLHVGAPAISGAGTGKGLLIRAICAIAFGVRPRAFTAGHDRQELDKRIGAELVEAAPILFLDNMNSTALHSAALASVLTERPARVRVLGYTRMVALNSIAFITITGNGLRLSEDLARCFLCCYLDAFCEDPEKRPFPPGFIESIERRRAELLGASLTIWRYGRQNAAELIRGIPLGSYETWCEWVRDPLLTLGCSDPVKRIEEVKARDPHRQQIAELFRTWAACHGVTPVKATNLADEVKRIIDPQGRGRQYIAARLGNLIDTRAAGFALTCQPAAGQWGAATYALSRAGSQPADPMQHRDHRGPMPPMGPMPDEVGAEPLGDDIGDLPPETEMVL